MRRWTRIILLSAGAVLGYGLGFRAMHEHRDRRLGFERHVADVCIEAYQRQHAAAVPPRPATE